MTSNFLPIDTEVEWEYTFYWVYRSSKFLPKMNLVKRQESFKTEPMTRAKFNVFLARHYKIKGPRFIKIHNKEYIQIGVFSL